MKKLLYNLAASSLLIAAASCHHAPKEPSAEDKAMFAKMDSTSKADSLSAAAPAAQMTFAQAQDKSNNKRKVIMTGYISVPHISYQSGKNAQLGFVERPNQANGDCILSLPTGSGKNTMKELPDKYKESDVVITGKNGEKIGMGDRVQITGQLDVNSDYFAVDMTEIEKLEPLALDYSTLNATKITTKPGAEQNGKFVVAEGTLEMPMMSMSGESTFMYLHVPGITDQLTVDVLYGEGPGKMGILPENYTSNDVVINDNSNKPVNLKKKVRVYGVWKDDRLKVESVENI